VDASKLPRFTITSATVAETLKANARSLISLLVWLIAPFAFAYTKFVRYDVR
jgi:ABC-type transport system involved in multi-copper enzyme maturation permease subunit